MLRLQIDFCFITDYDRILEMNNAGKSFVFACFN